MRWLHPLPWWGQKLSYFLGLAATIMAGNIIAYAVSTALFLNRIGPTDLPNFYILLGLLSVPLSICFSQVIDRLPRPLLFRGLLGGALLLSLLLRLAVILDSALAYYALSVSGNFLELLFGILLWTLLSDYFTSLELKRYTPLLAMAMTIGGFTGGVIVKGLSHFTDTRNLLLVLPIVYLGAMFQLRLIERNVRQLDQGETIEDADTFWESLQSFPKLLIRYPVVLWLAIGTFVAVWLWQLSELQFFFIYSHAFPDEAELTGFLGTLSAWFSFIELLTSYFLTRPLIQWLGVNRMNLVYPATTLISFLGLAFSFQIPAAIVANVNYDPLSSSVAQAVQNLNYNALPHRFMGRVRVIIDGLFYPISQALTGVLLILQQRTLTAHQLTLFGIFLSLLFLGVGYLTGRSYLKSMLALLRSGSVSLDEVEETLTSLPTSYSSEVRTLLSSPDLDAQLLGLNLAIRLEDPSQFLDEVQDLLLHRDPTVRQAVVKFLSSCRHPNVNRYLRTQLIADSEAIRAIVLEALITSRQPLSTVQLQFFLQDPDAEVRALACVAAEQAAPLQPDVQQLYDSVRSTLLEPSGQQAVIRLVQQMQDRQLLPLILEIMSEAPASVKQVGLEALAMLVKPRDYTFSELVAIELDHPAAIVRAAALRLASVIQDPDLLPQIADCLEDQDGLVRQQAIKALVVYRHMALPLVQKYLYTSRPEVAEAAVAVIGAMPGRRSEDILFQYLQAVYEFFPLILHWHCQIPGHEPLWRLLDQTLKDSQDRLLHQVFQVLASLGYGPVIESAKQLLTATDVRRRANAVETLVAIDQRRFIQPLMPLLEHMIAPTPPPMAGSGSPGSFKVLDDLLQWTAASPAPVAPLAGSSRWLRVSTLFILAESIMQSRLRTGEPISLRHLDSLQNSSIDWNTLRLDDDRLVREIATHVTSARPESLLTCDYAVNRILFLKQIPLFQSLTLDDLLLIEGALKQQIFLAGEIIFREAAPGDDFHIIYRGTVTILKQVGQTQRELAQLTSGQYFGDMALFDQEPRSATAIAVTDCVLLTLERNHFHRLITQRPEIILQMCRVLSLRLRETNARLH